MNLCCFIPGKVGSTSYLVFTPANSHYSISRTTSIRRWLTRCYTYYSRYRTWIHQAQPVYSNWAIDRYARMKCFKSCVILVRWPSIISMKRSHPVSKVLSTTGRRGHSSIALRYKLTVCIFVGFSLFCSAENGNTLSACFHSFASYSRTSVPVVIVADMLTNTIIECMLEHNINAPQAEWISLNRSLQVRIYSHGAKI